jgi:hypothetical protein
MSLAISKPYVVTPANEAQSQENSASPPFRGEREGPRRDSGGEGEVGPAANCPSAHLTLAGGEG